jgi:hypothetical protein
MGREISHPPFEVEAKVEVETLRPKRRRRPSFATLIRQVRKAGERGQVRIEQVNADGSRTIVTSTSEGAIERMTEADAERMWHERIAKHAH